MKTLRVAHVITRLCQGGAQENTFHTACLANRERFEVDLISGPTEGAEGSIEDRVRDAGLDIIREPNLIRNVSPGKDLLALKGLTTLFKSKRYDIVHTHTSKAGALGRLAAKRAKVPIIVHTPHGNIFDGYFSPLATRIFVHVERRSAKWTDRLVELTEGGIEEYLQRGIGTRAQYIAIFSGIDLAPYEQARAKRQATRALLGVDPGDLLVGGVGRLEQVKGFTYFIDAAQRIAQAMPRARFMIAGHGSLRSDLVAQASGLGDRLTFLGMRNDVPELLAAMDILVVPSLNEGMGRVILEAGAAGTVVVASRVGGIPEIVQDSVTGLLVPPREPEAIAAVVQAAGRDPDRLTRMGEAARAYVVPDFGLDRMVMRIESLYEELAQEKHLDT